jgi:hypothetical protein
MRVRAVCAALVCATIALPAQAVADHGIASAVRSSGEPLPAGSGGQPAGGPLVSDLRTTPGSLEQVGHSPLLNRGMNAAPAVKGDYAYVGSRTDGTHLNSGVLVVNVSRPSRPRVVGEIGPPNEGNPGETSRELRIWPRQNLLMVLNHGCSELIHRCVGGQAVRSTIRFYDISGRNAARPELVSTFLPSRSRPQVPHEFFLWVDPDDPKRALIYYTNPSSADQELIVTDISGARKGRFTEIDEFKVDLPENGMDNRLHSLGISNDGTRGYLAYLGGGFMVVDTSDFANETPNPQVRLITPVEQRVFWTDPGAHSAVKLFGRPFALTTDEVYGKLGGVLPDHGCPWGWVRTIDIADEQRPSVIGEYRVAPHNFPGYCPEAPPDQENLSSQSAHNPTLTPNLALVTWHSRGFQLISIEDPRQPRRVAEFSPQPLAAVQTEDPALSSGRDKVVMWSYPIVKDGLIYLVDLRNGLYILRYRGPCQEEVRSVDFLEGNSNLGDALRFEESATGTSYAGGCAGGNTAPEPASSEARPGSAAAAAPPAFPSAAFDAAELRRD